VAAASIGSIIALFLGILLTICCCTTIAYGIVKMIFTRARMRQQVVVDYNHQYYPQYGNVYLNGQYGQSPYVVSPTGNQIFLNGSQMQYTVAEATVIGATRGDGSVPVAAAEAIVGDAYAECPQPIVQVLPVDNVQSVESGAGTVGMSMNSNPNYANGSGYAAQNAALVPQAQPAQIQPIFFRRV
jgi:hypothetical protein